MNTCQLIGRHVRAQGEVTETQHEWVWPEPYTSVCMDIFLLELQRTVHTVSSLCVHVYGFGLTFDRTMRWQARTRTHTHMSKASVCECAYVLRCAHTQKHVASKR